jgi:hypothetical protein
VQRDFLHVFEPDDLFVGAEEPFLEFEPVGKEFVLGAPVVQHLTEIGHQRNAHKGEQAEKREGGSTIRAQRDPLTSKVHRKAAAPQGKEELKWKLLQQCDPANEDRPERECHGFTASAEHSNGHFDPNFQPLVLDIDGVRHWLDNLRKRHNKAAVTDLDEKTVRDAIEETIASLTAKEASPVIEAPPPAEVVPGEDLPSLPQPDMLHQLLLLRGMLDAAAPPSPPPPQIDYDQLQAAAKALSAKIAAAEAEEETAVALLLLSRGRQIVYDPAARAKKAEDEVLIEMLLL